MDVKKKQRQLLSPLNLSWILLRQAGILTRWVGSLCWEGAGPECGVYSIEKG